MPSLSLSILDHPAPRLLDEDGRPVAEVGSEVEGAPTERVPCPYADRRRGLPMNQSALRQVGRVLPSVLDLLASGAGPAPVTVRSALHASIVGTSAVVHHQLAHPGAPVPRELAALYKASLGLSQLFGAMCLADPELGDAELSALGDADGFFALLDEGGWLVGQVEVCAGSRPMIGQVFEALCAGTPARAPSWGPEALWATTSIAVALVAAPTLHRDAPRLARLHGPKGPSWARALFGSPTRIPRDLGGWLVPGEPRDSVEALADRLHGCAPGAVEAELERHLENLGPEVARPN